MQGTLIRLVTFAALAPPAAAQEESRFFRDSAIDYWGEGRTQMRKEPASQEAVSLWAEPVRTPDGRWSVYLPSKEVRDFLDRPTRENAEQYLAWQEERMRRIRQAAQILRQVQEERSSPLPPAEITYFKKPGCPWCAEEDQVLAAIAKRSSGLKLRVVTPESDPALWNRSNVRVVPTLVIAGPGGQKRTVQGFLPAEELARAIEDLSSEALAKEEVNRATK